MNARRLWLVLVFALFGSDLPCLAQQQSRVQQFYPQGTVARIRQVRVQFSAPMVSFGDPHGAISPFNVSCAEKGSGRWADQENWAYDFDRDLPAGIRCVFVLLEDLRSLDGSRVTGQRRFEFSSGGPSVTRTFPFEGAEAITDDQIFVLELNGAAVESSVLANVSFSVQGISEKIGIRIVAGQERETVLNSVYPPRGYPKRPEHVMAIQAKRRSPFKSQVNIVWGAGVLSPTGVATAQDQVLPFKTRSPFAANFHCQRENAEANCVPVTPMHLSFSNPVPWKTARNVILKGPAGKVWKPERRQNEDEDDSSDETVWDVVFKAPFPEESVFTLEIPKGLEDESGRALTNAGSFPLTVRTDQYPPLAKFAADFGILELKSGPVLPVTLRNVEPELFGRIFELEGGEQDFDPIPAQPQGPGILGNVRGRILRLPADKANQMIAWIDKVSNRRNEDRDKSIFGTVTYPKTKPFSLPKPNKGKSFEVVGIPIKEPGFYVVELESEILGASLLGISKPMFVPTTVLATNLSVHFKWGGESSLVWVTTLDKAEPVSQAVVEVRDCEGKVYWKGTTDRLGTARTGPLPNQQLLPYCSGFSYSRQGLMVTAQLKDDLAFVHSSWDRGIEKWRYNLPTEWQPQPRIIQTILDRSLLRAGETVHMKHVLRRKTLAGFALDESDQPKEVIVQHSGSNHQYKLPLKWDAAGTAETVWSIPKEARLGNYQINFEVAPKKNAAGRVMYYVLQSGGSFRVEEFRVPLMRAVIRPPSEPLINPSDVPVDLTVSYLSGGGASNLPVKLRYDVKPRYIGGIEGFENYSFSNGAVKTGIFRGLPEETETRETIKSSDLTLGKSGSTRSTLSGLSASDVPRQILAELEFRDPNGEVQTASSSIPLWPSARLIGLIPDSWMQSKDSLRFKVAVLDLNRKPVANAPVTVDLFQRKHYSHRKRLVGGFYAYESYNEVKRLGSLCEGNTDKKGLLICTKPAPASGELIIQAVTKDQAGRQATANQGIWIAGESDWWFGGRDDDRIDLLPEKKRYEPGEKARFQVRMPFRKATALVSIEREGVGETFVQELSGKEPVVEIPVKGAYAPNVFVSVLVVRGRVTDSKPTATVDLGRPAYKLGIAEINVGWRAHELKVKVSADRQQYTVREKAKVQIAVTTPEGAPPGKGAEVALAAVDEGLLELMPNNSWQLLDAMMGRRSYNVQTSTAQMHVIGKRHFGLKALPQGGGGGNQITRELFDTLLLWKGRVALDDKGTASVEVPLNDSITSFRIVAVATSGANRFGTGSTSIRSSRDLILLSGIAPVVRQGDTYRSTFTVRNTMERPLNVQITAKISGIRESLKPQTIALASGESRDIFWILTAPAGTETLRYEVDAETGTGIADRLAVTQKVLPAVPVHAFQATLTQVSGDYRLDVERPGQALPGVGGVDVSLKPKLVEGLTGVSDYMSRYPYTCLEQVVSRAVALQDTALWKRITGELPAFLDSDGLLKYFPSMHEGSDVLTSYVLSVSRQAGFQLPQNVQDRIAGGLRGFIEGRVVRYSSLPTVDLSIRKLSAIEALSTVVTIDADLLSTIRIQPNLWPTSGVLDWMSILRRTASIRDRDARLGEAEQILKARLIFQGTVMNFSTEKSDCLWWMMISPDENASRLVLSALESPSWKSDIARLVRGALARQRRGHWDTTVANAWGVLAMTKFSQMYESTPVTGISTISLEGSAQNLNWSEAPKGRSFLLPWPAQRSTLAIHLSGGGQPWAMIRSMAAIPLKEPLSSGFKIKKSMTPVEQPDHSGWRRGDLVRVRLEVEAQSDMTWVVVNDPIPAGAAILGSGLGRDSRLARRGEKWEGWVWPAFEERSFEAFRSYYDFVPKGTLIMEYTMRLNNEGTMNLPPTRVEAMYSPEMFGELPNQPVRIQ